jgi:methyl-accepting chemotaxis protein
MTATISQIAENAEQAHAISVKAVHQARALRKK